MEDNQNEIQEALNKSDSLNEETFADGQNGKVQLEQTLPTEQETDLAQDVADTEPNAEKESLPFDFALNDNAEKESKKMGKGAFFAVFGGVFCICLALLVLVLFAGGNGIRIFKTLYSERTVYVHQEDVTGDLLSAQEAADVIRKSTVTISVRTANEPGIGSGFVYDENGHICTNYHVIANAVSIQVVLPDGKALDAEVVGYDIPSDLAVLRVQASDLVPAKLGSSADLLTGDQLVAVGTPADLMFAGTATFGKVSYARRLLPVDDDGDGIYEKKLVVIQTDASVNPGNSGGPMADMYGRVVGVVVRKIINYHGNLYEGIGFAIPIDGAKAILDAIIKDGSFSGENPVVEGRSILGVSGYGVVKGTWYCVDPATDKVLSSEEEKEGYTYMSADGVCVSAIINVNAKNKLFPGDVILALNGLAVRDTKGLIDAVNCYPCGEIVTVSVWRGDAQITVDIRLAEE